MSILPFPEAAREAPGSTQRSAWERIAAALAVAFGAAGIAAVVFALCLACAVIYYDGPHLRFGGGGLRLFAEASAGEVTLAAFSATQRATGALLVLFLIAPVVFILHEARGVASSFADGRMFSHRSAQCLRRMAGGFIAYACAPPLAHAIATRAGIAGDPIWLRFETLGALLLSIFLTLLARMIAHGQDIARDRDGFV